MRTAYIHDCGRGDKEGIVRRLRLRSMQEVMGAGPGREDGAGELQESSWQNLETDWLSGVSLPCACSVTRSCPHELWPTRLFCPWDFFFFFFLGKNIGMGGHFLLQGIFLDTGIKPVSPAFQADSSPLSHWEAPRGEGKE